MGGAILGSRSDVGWVGAAGLQSAAAIAVAVHGANEARRATDKQFQIADRNLKISEFVHGLMVDHYYPCEIKHLKEACETEEYATEYEEQAGRFATTVAIQFAKTRQQLQQTFNRYYCSSHSQAVAQLIIAEAKATTDAINYGYRYAEARSEAKNDVRWARIQQSLQLGRGNVAAALNYSNAAGNTFSSLGTQAAASANSAIERLSFLQNRNSPVDVPTYNPQSGLFQVGATNQQVATTPPLQQKELAVPKFDIGMSTLGSGVRYGGDPNNQSNLNMMDFGVGVSGDK